MSAMLNVRLPVTLERDQSTAREVVTSPAATRLGSSGVCERSTPLVLLQAARSNMIVMLVFMMALESVCFCQEVAISESVI
ncbi:MAG: hypothetical protein ACKO32_12980 [Planctomycetia bacterium]